MEATGVGDADIRDAQMSSKVRTQISRFVGGKPAYLGNKSPLPLMLLFNRVRTELGKQSKAQRKGEKVREALCRAVPIVYITLLSNIPYLGHNKLRPT